MAKALSILYVTSEVYPYAKETGLADTSYSFPLAMRDLGHDIRVMTPKYGIVSERKNKIHEINRLRDMPIPIGEETDLATVKSSSIANPRVKVQAYITTNSNFFDKNKGIYHDVKTWEEYPDNAERFIFFCRSVVETCLLLGWFPDIIHCNDWHASLIPAYLRTLFPSKFKKTRSILTIHDGAEQGVMPVSMFGKTGLNKDVLPLIKHKNQVNLLKAGILYSNYITTTSPAYAKQLLSDKDHTNGLNAFLKEHAAKFVGHSSGIDNYIWTPDHDDFIASKYNYDPIDFKYNNKVALLNKFGLEYSPKTPTLGMAFGFEERKGMSLLIDSLDELLQMNVQVVLLGQVSNENKEKLDAIIAKHNTSFNVIYQCDEPLSHQVVAGSDIYLAPSLYEANGVQAMTAMAYGTVPVLRNVGAHTEFAKEYSTATGEGNAFTFEKYEKADFLASVKKAVDMFKDKEQWEKVMKNGMDGEYAWAPTAKKYDEIYKNIMKEQNS